MRRSFIGAPNPSPPFDREDYWKRDGSSVNAVSFGFLATAILISVFLVMAILERFLRSRPSFPPVSSLDDGEPEVRVAPGSQVSGKRDDAVVEARYAMGVSVLMPGQDIPTFIANPAPIPCSLEGNSWPTFEQNHTGTSSFLARSTPTMGKAEDNDNGVITARLYDTRC